MCVCEERRALWGTILFCLGTAAVAALAPGAGAGVPVRVRRSVCLGTWGGSRALFIQKDTYG